MNIALNLNIYNIKFLISIIIFSLINFFLFELYKNYCTSSKLLDIPNKRSSHTIATPKGAGIIIVYYSDLFKYFSLSNGHFENILFFIFLVIGSVGIINFFNFSDGIDGLVASSASIYLILIGFYINPIFLVIGVALFIFLIFNWFPAKLFMGDVGSTFIGAVVVISALSTNNSLDSLASLLMIAPIIMDPFFCVIRRLLSKQNIFIAHKTHLYQRLHQSGWKHSNISLIYSAATLLLSLSFIFFGMAFSIVVLSFVFFVGLYLDVFHAVPFIRS